MSMMQMVLTFIAISLSCALAGAIIAAIRIRKYIRRERILANRLKWELHHAETDAVKPKGDRGQS